MKHRASPLRLLIAALDGRLPDESAWPKVLETANRGWLVPALYVALRKQNCIDAVPEPVRDYLALLHDRNAERNRRLRAQLSEAVGALNRKGIEPILLKGGVSLFTAPDDSLGARMLSDLDINLEPSEMRTAKDALAELGYRERAIPRELGRPQDVGEIELHDRPSRRSAAYLKGDLRAWTSVMEKDGATARIPDPTARALHLIVHDMIKEGDYWRLRIDLRHLHDLAELARAPEGVDWRRLRDALSSEPARAALELQAIALADLYRVSVPGDLIRGLLTRLRHSARLATATQGLAGYLSRAAGNLSWGLHRLRDDYSWEGAGKLMRRARGVFLMPAKGSRL